MAATTCAQTCIDLETQCAQDSQCLEHSSQCLEDSSQCLEDSQCLDGEAICDVVGSGKPEGETVLTLPDLAEPLERLAKRQKHEIKEPTHFRVKWVITDVGPVPFAMDCESQVVYCGKAQMTVHYGAGSIPSVMCLKGCTWKCGGHGMDGQCGCHCHILQWYYKTRWPEPAVPRDCWLMCKSEKATRTNQSHLSEAWRDALTTSWLRVTLCQCGWGSLVCNMWL